ncbi:uncharacterized protein LOC126906996 [Daktulosphaira vitifoliae]|uniref:uncharacterized protein LOC126906996 n=1 Tax=Daktulosphaira vitifoliae TaxID=58002 RepID=UPI0021AAF316|nr:uncharacterized protein LOC126906996 [Daktulosphaira vitifoliae]
MESDRLIRCMVNYYRKITLIRYITVWRNMTYNMIKRQRKLSLTRAYDYEQIKKDNEIIKPAILRPIIANKRKNNVKGNVDTINHFLRQKGWININDVEFITYFSNKFLLEDVIKTVTKFNCDSTIRHATVFLGCSYANDLNKMFIILNKFQEHCHMILRSKNFLNIAHNCTVKLVEKIDEITSLATFMKGALDAIEVFHTFPWSTHKNKQSFILCTVIANLQKEETLKKLVPLENTMNSINLTLMYIKRFLLTRHIELLQNMKYCTLKPLDSDSMWNFWDKELGILKSQEKYQEFFLYLNNKIINLVQTIIQKKYVELGFVFNSDKNQTFLPDSSTVFNIGFVKYPSINMIQNTNNVNIQEEITQKNVIENLSINSKQYSQEIDILEIILREHMEKYPFLNFIQHNDEVDIEVNTRQEDVTQNYPINLMHHNYEKDYLEEIVRECMVYNSSIESIQYTNEVNIQEGITQKGMAYYSPINFEQNINEINIHDGTTQEDVIQNSPLNSIQDNYEEDYLKEIAQEYNANYLHINSIQNTNEVNIQKGITQEDDMLDVEDF